MAELAKDTSSKCTIPWPTDIPSPLCFGILQGLHLPRNAGRCLFLEVYGGCGNLTAAVAEAVLKSVPWYVLPYIDIMEPICGVRLNLDLGVATNVEVLMRLIQEHNPFWIHVGPPCTFWTPMSRFTARRTAASWSHLRELAYP